MLSKFSFKKNRYFLSSNLVLITFIIGVVNLFFLDYQSSWETVILILILLSRYLLFVLIRRRFEWSKYLLLLLIFRGLYRIVVVFNEVDAHQVTKINVALQLIMSIVAFVILIIMPTVIKKISLKKPDAFEIKHSLPFEAK
jgi:hypothetical protein